MASPRLAVSRFFPGRLMSAHDRTLGRKGPRLLVTYREQAIWLERAKVHADHGRVIYRTAQDDLIKDYSVPYANLAILFLGQGTSITQEAARLLSEEGVFVAFTGTGGSPLFYGALTSYSGTAHFRRMLTAYSDEEESLIMARKLMHVRCDFMEKVGSDLGDELLGLNERALGAHIRKFRKGIDAASSIPSLLGKEGEYSKGLYAIFAGAGGFSKSEVFTRNPGDGQRIAKGLEPVALANSCIDHGNYLAYGFAGAALWALGIPPHMPVFHGKTRSGGLVFDLADSVKEAVVLPYAFAAAKGKLKGDPETVFRGKVMSTFRTRKILATLIGTMDATLPADMAGPSLNPGRKP